MTQWGLDTLFNPAKRHMDEEKQRLQSTREEVGDNSGGKRIDFDAGKVKIAKPGGDDGAESRSDTAPNHRSDDEPEDRSDDRSGERSSNRPATRKPEPSAAAVRAAKRRGRTAG